jgi:DNA-binding beta-propeller fold protein YncE
VFTWLMDDPASPLRLDLRPLYPHFVTPDETWFPYRLGWLLVAGSLIVLLGVGLLWRQRQVAALRAPRWPVGARFSLVLGSLALLGAAWGIVSYDFLRPKTTLDYVASWPINAPLDTAGGITYLDGKVYIALYGQRGDQEVPGTVGVFDVSTGSYATLTPVAPARPPLAWTHPGSVAVGPDGLLYVLNNGPGDQALLAMQPDGRVVRRIALENKSVVGMGLFFDDEGYLYVADQSNGVILQYNPEGGKPLAVLTGKEDILNNPRGVAVDPDGNIYTTETFNRIQKLDKQGNLNTIYDLNCRPRYFAAPTEAGPWLEASCSTGLVSLNTAENYVQFTHVAGDGPQPESPRGIAYAPDARLYVLDGNTLFAYTVRH